MKNLLALLLLAPAIACAQWTNHPLNLTSDYTLPTATSSVLGGVKPDGTTITNSSGVISVNYGTTAGTALQGNAAPGSAIVGITDAQTLSNKTISNPISVTSALTDQSSITWDANSDGTDVTLTLTASGHTLGAMANPKVGGTYTVAIIQGGSGSYTMSWNAGYKWPSGIAPTLTTTVSSVDIIVCKYLASQMNCAGQFDFK